MSNTKNYSPMARLENMMNKSLRNIGMALKNEKSQFLLTYFMDN